MLCIVCQMVAFGTTIPNSLPPEDGSLSRCWNGFLKADCREGLTILVFVLNLNPFFNFGPLRIWWFAPKQIIKIKTNRPAVDKNFDLKLKIYGFKQLCIELKIIRKNFKKS
ncbi:hypothetical protein BpHYR1_046527 [Brachionus plicatilis]|uniref:Uncharacterized protein n=1 Tax=Brachionus plicatilis TaxID=10195 RepID=A0A3M7PQM0_BRAPC|nr:hypothetical protein BpHYR1_046527 [Brachionus plicatilis]